ncbi:MAG: YihY/virulence factor BrkB family protein [Acidobacteriota bacterium]|nr:YihY/virulence factor BrkB family protein [Acidobacteriota bacterium]
MKSEWNWRFVRGVLNETAAHWFKRGAMSQSASLAFFTLVSLAPLLVLVVSVAGSAFGRVAVRHELVGQFQRLMGKEQAVAVEKILKTASQSGGRGLAGVVGIGTLIFGATAVFAQLQSSLNRMWDVQPKPGSGILGLLKKRLLSLALIVGLGFLLLVSLAFSAAMNASQEYFRARLPLPALLLDVAGTVFSFLIFTLLFAAVFRILPDIEIPWRDVWVGALATSFLFSIGKWAIGLYLGRTALGSAYGAAASAIVLLFWVYYASMLVLLGAAFTRVHSRHRRELESPGGERARSRA